MSSSRFRRIATSARLRAALSLGVVTAIGATGTFAYWSDAVTVPGTTFTAGTISLQVNGADDTISNYTALNVSTMVPGNSVAATLVIKNNGTAPLTYTATSTATGDLNSALALKVTADTAVTGTAPATTCNGTAMPGSGSALGGSVLSTPRTLAAGASETICIQVTLSTTAPTSLQGTTSTVGLVFTGMQLT